MLPFVCRLMGNSTCGGSVFIVAACSMCFPLGLLLSCSCSTSLDSAFLQRRAALPIIEAQKPPWNVSDVDRFVSRKNKDVTVWIVKFFQKKKKLSLFTWVKKLLHGMRLSYQKPAKCVKELHSPALQEANTHRLFIKLCWLMDKHAVSADPVVNIDETTCRASDRVERPRRPTSSVLGQHKGGHDIHCRLQHRPWPAAHAGADRASGQERRRHDSCPLRPRWYLGKLGHEQGMAAPVFGDRAARAVKDLCAENKVWSTGWRQLRAQSDAEFHEAVEEPTSCTPFARQIEPERVPEDPVEWTMAEASDDEDDAPMPERAAWAGAHWHATGSSVCTPDVELGALHRIALGVRRLTALMSPNKNCHLHHFTSCSLLSHVSVVPCVFVLCVLPRIPEWQEGLLLFYFRDGLKKCWHKVISAQCHECQSDADSNKRGCGVPAQAQASARVDVPTARVPRGPRSPTRVQVFVRMLGYVHGGQPTVILRRKNECLDMCTAVNRPWSLHSIEICNICNVFNFYADLLLWN